MKKHKKLAYSILMIFVLINSILPSVSAAEPPIVGTENASHLHLNDAKQNDWYPVSIDGYFVRADTNQLRANWHSDRATGVDLGGIGYDSPNDYTPPNGKVIHSIIGYPVYQMRTYDVQKDNSGCAGGFPIDNQCNPFFFDGDAGEDNRWAKSPNIITADHWKLFDTVVRYNSTLKKDMTYYRFRTAQIRKKDYVGFGHGGTPWYKYDFKIMDNPNAIGLRIDPPTITVKVGETADYKALYKANDGMEYDKTTDGASTWSSGDTSIATTSTKGKFVGKKVGTTTVKVVYGSLSATATIKVIADNNPIGLRIEPPTQTVKVGDTANYTAIYKALDGLEYDKTNDAASTWSSLDTSIGTTSSKGKFVGKKVGTTTVKVVYGSLSATAILNVIDSASPPPSTGDGNSGCERPQEVPDRYEYEMDLEVTRLDARTVDKGSQTNTDVYVKRTDYSSSRNQAKNEFNQYIQNTERQKADCEVKKADFEKQKQQAETEKTKAESEKTSAMQEMANAESSLSTCQATPPDEDGKTPDCSSYQSTISNAQSKITQADTKISEQEAKVKEFEEKIKDAEKFIAEYIVKIQKANNELQYIQNDQSRYSVVNPNVILRNDGKVVSSINVSLSEGESNKRYTFPSWTLNGDGSIMAQINEGGPYNEFTYQPLQSRSERSLGFNARVGNVLYPSSSSNNWKSTPIYIATYNTASCPNPNDYFASSSVEAVVRTINDNGSQREIKERVTSSFSLLPRTEMRAGYGFEYSIQTVYQNFDTEPEPSSATGTKSIESMFPTLVNYLPYTKGNTKISFDQNGQVTSADEGYQVVMETANSAIPRNETKNWNLPPVAIEEFSGNIFSIRNNDYQTHSKRNYSETLLTTDKKTGKPLNRWYVDFEQPDGYYDFKVRTYDAGVNHLNTCQTGRILIDGSTTGEPNSNDDYVKRSVTPSNPFPGGVGWNWSGKVDQIESLNEWYTNWYKEPNSLPLNSYQNTFYLTPELMQKIREYNKSVNHEIKLGNSIFDSIDIPNDK